MVPLTWLGKDNREPNSPLSRLLGLWEDPLPAAMPLGRRRGPRSMGITWWLPMGESILEGPCRATDGRGGPPDALFWNLLIA